jgi:hypothetical protein
MRIADQVSVSYAALEAAYHPARTHYPRKPGNLTLHDSFEAALASDKVEGARAGVKAPRRLITHNREKTIPSPLGGG